MTPREQQYTATIDRITSGVVDDNNRIWFLQFLLKQEQERYTRGQEQAEAVVDLVCSFYGITQQQITNCTRKRYITEPREIAMTLIRQSTQLTIEEIGAIFNRHHSTVIAAGKRVDCLLFSDKVYRAQFRALRELIEQP